MAYDIDGEWPYVEEIQGNESEQHVLLKNIAVEYLLENGFSHHDIEIEKRFGGMGCVTDVYASRGTEEVYVECETGGSVTTKSAPGKAPARKGKIVLVVSKKFIYRLRYVGRELEGISGPQTMSIPHLSKICPTHEYLPT